MRLTFVVGGRNSRCQQQQSPQLGSRIQWLLRLNAMSTIFRMPLKGLINTILPICAGPRKRHFRRVKEVLGNFLMQSGPKAEMVSNMGWWHVFLFPLLQRGAGKHSLFLSLSSVWEVCPWDATDAELYLWVNAHVVLVRFAQPSEPGVTVKGVHWDLDNLNPIVWLQISPYS